MTIMEGDKCIGCHYKIGGELDENGTKATFSKGDEFAADGTNGTEATLSIEDEFSAAATATTVSATATTATTVSATATAATTVSATATTATTATFSIGVEFAANGTMTPFTLFSETGSTESRTFNIDDEFNADGTMIAFTLFSEIGSTDTRKIAYVLPAKSTITDDAAGVREVASWE